MKLPRCPVTLKAMRTREQANQWVADYRRKKTPHMPRMRVYQCPHCHAWHFTHHATYRPKHKRTKGVSW